MTDLLRRELQFHGMIIDDMTMAPSYKTMTSPRRLSRRSEPGRLGVGGSRCIEQEWAASPHPVTPPEMRAASGGSSSLTEPSVTFA
nr:hypothetical protein [Kyrpidia spormannii]